MGNAITFIIFINIVKSNIFDINKFIDFIGIALKYFNSQHRK